MYIADDTPANNSMRVLDDGIVEIVETGHQTKASTKQFVEKVSAIITERRQKHQKALILTDVSGVTGHDSDVLEESEQLLHNDYDGIALVGENVTMRMIANWIIKTAGQGDRVRFFATRDEALAWLRTR